jgi:hypothetical protein
MAASPTGVELSSTDALEVKMSSLRRPLVLVLVLVATVAACSGGPSGASCAAPGICAVLTSGEATCPSGSTEVPSCPTANVLGTCTFSGTSNTRVIYFYGASTTLAEAQSTCQAIPGATWTPG